MKCEKMTNNEDDSNKLKYTRRLYENLIHWYESAEKKAHILLSLDGVFLTFISSSIYLKKELILEANSITLFFLFMMGLCLILSIYFALHSLWSQISFNVNDEKSKTIENPNKSSYSPKKIWFFQDIMKLECDKFIKSLESMNVSQEIQELGSEIYILSSNVNRKHRRVNISFIFSGLMLIFFFASAITFAIL